MNKYSSGPKFVRFRVNGVLVSLKSPVLIFFSGGVLTPGAAFAETTLIERLDKAGVRFTTVEEPKAISNE